MVRFEMRLLSECGWSCDERFHPCNLFQIICVENPPSIFPKWEATKQHLPGLQCVGSGPHGKGSDSQRTRTLPGTSPQMKALRQRGHQSWVKAA